MVDNERGWDLKDRNGCGRNLFFLNLETLLEWEGSQSKGRITKNRFQFRFVKVEAVEGRGQEEEGVPRYFGMD